MALKAVLDALDDVQDATKPLYAETEDGKFVLTVSGIDDHPDVSNLRNAYRREKERREKLSSDLDEVNGKLKSIPDDFDPHKWEAAKKGEKLAGDLPELRKALEAERDAVKAERDKLKGEVYSLKVSNTLDEALKSNGITTPAFQKAARALLKDAVKLDDDGKAVIETDMGPQPIGDYVKRWVSGDEGKAFVSPAKGGGAGGSTGGSPSITKDQFDAMDTKARTELFRSDPETFKKLSNQ